ncbi:NAD(P)-binding protein [Leucogyrophana mollusca]|uniref:NAD(P)-binding protein n=1 Tax=Leucogyrophana mollusca TaxID=85980 RepID=A0ACB8BG97_9AGAM|nr:NAD(P)-binding protein [Leucogyrophana mollusca]
MAGRLPKSTHALVVKRCSEGKKPIYHDAILEERPIRPLKTGEILVKMSAVSFNHRDVWIRLGQYPGIRFGSTFGADGAGSVVAAADGNDPLLFKRVFLTPMRGWESDPSAPEAEGLEILGGGSRDGTFADYVVVERDQVIPSPDHLSDVQTSAWPLGGLTAWRAAIVNAGASQGQNILITGIGGGVALLAMQLCLAKGANVYVTSGSDEKIRKAVSLGAKAGVNYKSKDWPSQLADILEKEGDGAGQTKIDAVVDSGGGDIMSRVNKVLKAGGRVVCYGMTANPQIKFTMREVLKNQQLVGSTMGSHKDLIDATAFIVAHRIVPVVSHVLDGFSSAEAGFQLMKRGDQFGKIVIKLEGDGGVKARANL